MWTDVIDRFDRFAALRDEWRTLLSSSAQDHVYLAHEYLCAWWKHLAGSAALRVILVRDGEKIIAAAPMMIRWGTLLRWPVRRLEFVGAGWGYGAFILTERKKESLKHIMSVVRKLRGWDIMSLGRFIPDPEIDASEIAASTPPEFASHECVPGGVPYIPLRGCWNDYLAERSASFRRNLRNRTRKLNKLGSVRFQRVRRFGGGVEMPAVMSSLRMIADRSWKAGEKTAISSDLNVFGYYAEVAERLNDLGSLDVSLLWLNERPIAYIFGATYKKYFLEIDIAFDSELAKVAPGVYLRNCLLQELFEQNYEVYDFVAYFDYKRNLTSHLRRNDNHVFYRRAFYPLLLRSLRTVVRNRAPRVLSDYSDLSWSIDVHA